MITLLCKNRTIDKITLTWIANHQGELYKKIMSFCQSKSLTAQGVVLINGNTEDILQFFMHRLCYLPCRLMVFLSYSNQDIQSKEKVQWAEISRSLSHHVRRHISNILLALGILEKNRRSANQEENLK